MIQVSVDSLCLGNFFFCGTFSCKTPASQKNTCHFLYNNSAMEGASIDCIKTRGFSPENPSSNGKEAIFEGLSGVPRVPSRFIAPLRSATRLRRAPPIPAVLEYATIASTGSFRKKTPRASLLAPIPAVLEYATNLNSHTCLQTGTQFANKRLSCNKHTSRKPAPHLQQTHLKQTSAPHANTPLANKHT